MKHEPENLTLANDEPPASGTAKGVGSGPWLGGLEITCEDCMAPALALRPANANGAELRMSTHCQPPDHAASARIAANLPRFRPKPQDCPGGGQRPANRQETGKANRGWLTTERAKAIGKIGADKFAASKRGKSSLPRCVGCLLAIGWGIKRIVRHTGWAKTSVHRWAKFNGLNLMATA